MKHAICRGLDPNMFMPERGERQKIVDAKALCNICPVQTDCRDYGLELATQYETHGIFGGLTSQERQRILKARNQPRRAPRPT